MAYICRLWISEGRPGLDPRVWESVNPSVSPPLLIEPYSSVQGRRYHRSTNTPRRLFHVICSLFNPPLQLTTVDQIEVVLWTSTKSRQKDDKSLSVSHFRFEQLCWSGQEENQPHTHTDIDVSRGVIWRSLKVYPVRIGSLSKSGSCPTSTD